MQQMSKAIAKMKSDTEQEMKSEWVYKVGSECDWVEHMAW